MAKIKIEVSKEGKLSVEVEGIKGKKCLKLTEELEEKLGKVKARKKKPEFYNVQKVRRTT